MKVLVIGAGSVGQIYAYALQKGGADVSLFVKEKYVASSREGFILYPLNDGRNPQAVVLRIPKILSSIAEVQKEKWDALIFCIPSDGIRDSNFAELLKASGDASIVSMIPGEGIAEQIFPFIPAERLLTGVIGIISYPTPLPGEQRSTPGTAFWNAPFSASFLTGSEARVRPLIEAFRAGGLPFKMKKAQDQSPYSETILRVFVASLKRAGWTFDSFLQKDQQEIFQGAIREALQVLERRMGKATPIHLKISIVPLLRALLTLSRMAAPFDMEVYLRAHFTKVGVQMREGIVALIEEADRQSLPALNLRRL